MAPRVPRPVGESRGILVLLRKSCTQDLQRDRRSGPGSAAAPHGERCEALPDLGCLPRIPRGPASWVSQNDAGGLRPCPQVIPSAAPAHSESFGASAALPGTSEIRGRLARICLWEGSASLLFSDVSLRGGTTLHPDQNQTVGSFWPPFCPNPSCPQAARGERGGFLRHGHYTTRTRSIRIPRFLCRRCRRTMSSQTFDETYRLRRPDLEAAILQEVGRGYSLRQVARTLGINRKTVSRRLRRVRDREGAEFRERISPAAASGAPLAS